MERLSVVAVRVLVSGRVQGVGFRWHVREAGRRESLAGWVRNLPDGRVELLARGEAGAVERFLASVRAGPAGSVVQGVEREDIGVDGSMPYPFVVRK